MKHMTKYQAKILFIFLIIRMRLLWMAHNRLHLFVEDYKGMNSARYLTSSSVWFTWRVMFFVRQKLIKQFDIPNRLSCAFLFCMFSTKSCTKESWVTKHFHLFFRGRQNKQLVRRVFHILSDILSTI